MNATMLTKRIKMNVDYEAWKSLIYSSLNEYRERLERAKNVASKGFVDAPYLGDIQDLGPGNDPTYIYRINAPGWFFRYNITGENYSSDRFAVVLSSNPSNLVDNNKKSSKFLYCTSYSGGDIGGGNNMFPIYPGESTYAGIRRESTEDFRICFVPSREAFAYGIRNKDYVTKVGLSSMDDAAGDLQPSGTSSIFEGDWRGNFRTMFGLKVANDLSSDLKFVEDANSNLPAKNELIAERAAWLESWTVPLTDYTTLPRSGSAPITYKEYMESIQ